MTDESNVVELDQDGASRPIAEYPKGERLGVLVARYRIAAAKTQAEAAEHLGVTLEVMAQIECGMMTLSAGQLQDLAAWTGVRFEPLLEAAQDWHAAKWAEGGKTGGVQLAEMTTETMSLRQAEHELELALIKTADELVFAANVARETAIRAEGVALQARELLAARGVEVPGIDPMEGEVDVECSGPMHTNPKKLTRGKDFVLAYQGDGDGDVPFYFCSQTCAEAWSQGRSES